MCEFRSEFRREPNAPLIGPEWKKDDQSQEGQINGRQRRVMQGGNSVLCALLLLGVWFDGSGRRVLAASVGEVISLDAAIQESSPEPFGFQFIPATNDSMSGGITTDGTTPAIDYGAVSSRTVSTDQLTIDQLSLDSVSVGVFESGHAELRNATSYGYGNGTNGTQQECGNGVRDLREQCDDGNIIDGDGCSKECAVEGGWGCEAPSLKNKRGRCWLCKPTECTMQYNSAFSCLSTQGHGKNNQLASVYRRSVQGFCKCQETHCQQGDLCLKPEGGLFRKPETGQCGCGPSNCLMPMAKGPNSGALKQVCVKLEDQYVTNNVTGICDCAGQRAPVVSPDPALARKGSDGTCKIYPTHPIKSGEGESKFPAYQCVDAPYKFSGPADTPMQTRVCDSCAASACRLHRNVGTGGPGAVECVSNETMGIEGFDRGANGQCECDKDSCLVPHRDSYKCKRLKKAFPYGYAKTAEGKCGCAMDQNTCIMKTKTPEGATNRTNFMCLDLGTALKKTAYGKKFRRGSNGECDCLATSCKSDPNPESVGLFDCVDVDTNMAFMRSTNPAANGTCQCRKGSCSFSGDNGGTPMCAICPKAPGTCKSRCTQGIDVWGARTECVKYCSTKHVKQMLPPMNDEMLPLESSKMLGRVVECFVKKNVTCVKNTTALAWTCEQRVNANLLHNCPARWSSHANRDLPDGTSTMGYKSICDRDDLPCLLQKCDRTGSSGFCLEKMITV